MTSHYYPCPHGRASVSRATRTRQFQRVYTRAATITVGSAHNHTDDDKVWSADEFNGLISQPGAREQRHKNSGRHAALRVTRWRHS